MRFTRNVVALLAAALLAIAPAFAQSTPNGSSVPSTANVVSTSATITTTGGVAKLSPLQGQNFCTVEVVGSGWTGTLNVQTGTSFQNVTVSPYQSTAAQTGITTSGIYQARVPNANQIQVIGPTASGSAVVYLSCAYYSAQIAANDLSSFIGTAYGTINAAAYGAICNGTHDDSPAIQSAIAAAIAANGARVSLSGKCEAHGLSVTGSNVFLVGNGGATDDGTITPATSLTYNGTSGGTLITFSTPCATPPCGLHTSNVGLYNLEIGSGGGLAAYGAVFKGVFHPVVDGVSWVYDGGFTTDVFDLTYDTNLTIPGTGRAYFNRLAGSDTVGQTFALDGTYSDYFANIDATFQNGDLFHFGGGTTANDETDTDTLINVIGLGISGTGYAFDFDCDSNQIYGYSVDPGAPAAQVGVVRGTTSCASKQQVSFANQLTNYAYTTFPTVEAGGGLVIRESEGQVVSATPSGEGYYSLNSDIPAFFGTGGTLYVGKQNTNNPSVLLFGNSTGTHGITTIGSDPSLQCNDTTGSVLGVGNHGTAGAFCYDGTNLSVAVGHVSGAGHNVCSSTSGVPCETTGSCALSAQTTCNFTKTVPTSANCTATPNAADTTTVVEQFKTSLSTNTLTVTELASSSQTATASANVVCL